MLKVLKGGKDERISYYVRTSDGTLEFVAERGKLLGVETDEVGVLRLFVGTPNDMQPAAPFNRHFWDAVITGTPSEKTADQVDD